MSTRSYIIRDELNGAQALRFAAEVAQTSLAHIDTVEFSLRYASGVDVTGLAVIVRLYSQLQASGRELTLTEVPERIEAAFAAVGVTHLITRERRAWFPALAFRRRAFA